MVGPIIHVNVGGMIIDRKKPKTDGATWSSATLLFTKTDSSKIDLVYPCDKFRQTLYRKNATGDATDLKFSILLSCAPLTQRHDGTVAASVGTIAFGFCLLHGETASFVSSGTLHIRVTDCSPSRIHLLVINLISQLLVSYIKTNRLKYTKL